MRIKLRIGNETVIISEYTDCVRDLINNKTVRSMPEFNQHGGVDCLTHCLCVSLTSYRICKRLGFECNSAARGGLLHDFFLYDWHIKNRERGLHGFAHPGIALKNAEQYFFLNDVEREIIYKHMFPLSIIPPRHKETYVVVIIDKYYALIETLGIRKDKQYKLF